MEAKSADAIDLIEFYSPINEEGSWGQRPLADRARSTMELWFYKDCRGSIEWIVEELDLVEHIGLWFEVDLATGKRTLTDYDGVMSLPDQAMDLLEKHGIDVTEMRAALAD